MYQISEKQKTSCICQSCGRKIDFNMAVNFEITSVDDSNDYMLSLPIPHARVTNPFHSIAFECPECCKDMIQIDTEIAPMIQRLWSNGIETISSCQGHFGRPTLLPNPYDPSNSAYIMAPYIEFKNTSTMERSIKSVSFQCKKRIHIITANDNIYVIACSQDYVVPVDKYYLRVYNGWMNSDNKSMWGKEHKADLASMRDFVDVLLAEIVSDEKQQAEILTNGIIGTAISFARHRWVVVREDTANSRVYLMLRHGFGESTFGLTQHNTDIDYETSIIAEMCNQFMLENFTDDEIQDIIPVRFNVSSNVGYKVWVPPIEVFPNINRSSSYQYFNKKENRICNDTYGFPVSWWTSTVEPEGEYCVYVVNPTGNIARARPGKTATIRPFICMSRSSYDHYTGGLSTEENYSNRNLSSTSNRV